MKSNVELLEKLAAARHTPEDWDIVRANGMSVASNARMLVATLDDLPEAKMFKRNAQRLVVGTAKLRSHERALVVEAAGLRIYLRSDEAGMVNVVITKRDLYL